MSYDVPHMMAATNGNGLSKHIAQVNKEPYNEHNLQNLLTLIDQGIINYGVLVVDLDDVVRFVNPTACHLLNRSVDQLVGCASTLVFPFTTTSETQIVLPNDTDRSLEIRATDFIWQNAPAQLLMLQDITTHAQAIRSLEQRVHDMTAQNAELEAFAHTVAHDLKDPLNHIGLVASAVHEFGADHIESELLGYLDTIQDFCVKMNSIIDELLLLAEVGNADQLLLEPLQMDDIFAAAESRLAHIIVEKQADIVILSPWPSAIGYAPWVEEVWVNYLSNALKYGGTPPRIEVGGEKQEDGTTRFWIRDNGPGIPVRQQAALFTPFAASHTAPNSNDTYIKRHESGHGLGLSIVSRIVDKLGGQAGIDARPNGGSEFFFTLPASFV